MNKHDLIHKIKSLDTFSQDERAYLINLVNTKKKYGLVWEDKPEDVEEQLRENLPVLREVVERRILAKDLPQQAAKPIGKTQQSTIDFIEEEENTEQELLKEAEAPNHILIEGDNLHALTALTFTHEGKVDAMYFDPPYNTGAKDWRYNNDFVEKEDTFRHSKWISMIEKRLKIAKKLLNESGIICVTIDDYELPRLFLLMEEIFGEENHLGTLVIRNNPSGRSTVKGVSITHEYGLLFGKSNLSRVGRLERNEKQNSRYDELDDKGAFEWVNFRKHGGVKKEAPSMYYPFYLTENNFRLPELRWEAESKEWIILEEPKEDEIILYPVDEKGLERRWKWGIERVKNSLDEFCVRYDRIGKLGIYVKTRINEEGILPLTWWDKKEYSATSYGTNLLKEIFGELQIFSYPKSIYAVIDSLKILSKKSNSILLDIFAGSGTTLHATMQLNDEDGGNRQCILVTNNENNICEEVTYERNKRGIQGYTNAKGEKVPGLTNNNLRYYKSEFVKREPSLQHKKELTKLATELLCIKEDCYDDCTFEIIAEQQEWFRVFSNVGGQFLSVIYDDTKIELGVETIRNLIKLKNPTKTIKVYVFSNGQYPYTEEFEEVAEHITLCALPDAIYKAYQNVLPKKKRPLVPELEDNDEASSIITETDLFSQNN